MAVQLRRFAERCSGPRTWVRPRVNTTHGISNVRSSSSSSSSSISSSNSSSSSSNSSSSSGGGGGGGGDGDGGGDGSLDAASQASLEHLAARLSSSRHSAVFLTGAGLSAASGIATYRGGEPGAVWSSFVTDWGTKRRLKEGPTQWWNTYWLATHGQAVPAVHAAAAAEGRRTMQQGAREEEEGGGGGGGGGGIGVRVRPEPNAGHLAIDELCRRSSARGSRHRVVTQNVDGLHFRGARAAERRRHLIEIHGSAGRYRCAGHPTRAPTGLLDALLQPETADGRECPYSTSETLEGAVELGGVRFCEQGFPTIEEGAVPFCPNCAALAMPAVLFFDEGYRDHDAFRFDECVRWVLGADTLVTVGTSNSVGITGMLLQYAAARGMAVYDFNTEPMETHPVPEGSVRRVVGPAEVSLPLLCEAVLQ